MTIDRSIPLVTLHTVSSIYPRAEKPALRDISLDVRAGEYLLIVGQNGTGKSTLAKRFLWLRSR